MGEQVVENMDSKIDRLEAAMQDYELADCPLVHTFLPGMYVREILMKKDILITSLKHNTTHPFFVLQGKVSVYSDNDGEQLIEAPYKGTTTPGTRRVLYIHEDTVWITCHSLPFITGEENNFTDEEKANVLLKVEDTIIERHENKLIGGVVKNNIIQRIIN